MTLPPQWVGTHRYTERAPPCPPWHRARVLRTRARFSSPLCCSRGFRSSFSCLPDVSTGRALVALERRHGHRHVSATASAGTWPYSPRLSLTPNPTLKASPCSQESVAVFTASRRAPSWPSHCRQGAAAAMTGDAPRRSDLSAVVAHQGVRFIRRNTVVRLVSPEEPPSVSSGSPEQPPAPRVYDGRAPSVSVSPPCVAGGPNRPWAEPCAGPSCPCWAGPSGRNGLCCYLIYF
jgi:hypothetical protein